MMMMLVETFEVYILTEHSSRWFICSPTKVSGSTNCSSDGHQSWICNFMMRGFFLWKLSHFWPIFTAFHSTKITSQEMRTLWNISMMLLCIWLNVSISTEIGNQISLFGSHGCWFCHFTTREIFLRWFAKYFYDDLINSDLHPCVFLSDQKSDISTNCLDGAGFCNFMTKEIFQRWSDSLNLFFLTYT